MHTILVLCIIILLFTIHPASKRKCSINNNHNIFQRSLNTYDVHEREYQKIKHSIKYNFLLALFCCPSFQRLALCEVRFHITARFLFFEPFYFLQTFYYKHTLFLAFNEQFSYKFFICEPSKYIQCCPRRYNVQSEITLSQSK